MKRIFYLLCLVLLMGLVACNGQNENNEPSGDNAVEEPKEEEPVEEEKDTDEDSSNEENTEIEKDSANEEEEAEEGTTEEETKEPTVYQNEVFQDVVVSESADQFVVTGKAQVFEGVFQYKLRDGDEVLLEDNYQTEGAPAWGDFEITFEKELVTNDNVLLELFVYSAKDGSKVNVLEIPITP